MSSPRVIVLGAGASGEAAARWLADRGERVTLVDERPAADLGTDRIAALGVTGITVEAECLAIPEGAWDRAVVSPGIPLDHPWMVGLRAAGVPVVSEFQVGWQALGVPGIAVTGSLGKTSATTVLAEALRRAGWLVEAVGNIGRPLCDVAREGVRPDWLVAEISSFQIETTDEVRPEAVLLTNIYPNHLDRHGDFEVYATLKWKCCLSVADRGVCLVPVELIEEAHARAENAGRSVDFESFGAGAGDWCYVPGLIEGPAGQRVVLDGGWYDNSVYGPTAAGIAGVLFAQGQALPVVEAALQTFPGLPHRMERLGEVGGVRMINDSKGTCLQAMQAAVEMLEGPVHLIVGGVLKEKISDSVKEILALRGVKVYGVGEAAKTFEEAWSDAVPFRDCETLDLAVQEAFSAALPGETMLLSPGCASFDQFAHFMARGERFRELIGELADRHITTNNTKTNTESKRTRV